MCDYCINGICFHPKKNKKGFIAQKCEGCPDGGITETPDPKKEYINPLFI